MSETGGVGHDAPTTDDPGSGEGVDAELEGGLRVGSAAPALELSPRSPSQAGKSTAKRRQRRFVVGGLLVALAGAAGFLVTQLGSATTYYYNADQAVAKKASIGARTFRIQGTVVSRPAKHDSGEGERLRFAIAFNGVSVPCDYFGGEPSSLFKAGEPVVLVGHFDGDLFKASQIMVKHDSEYKAKHPERVSPGAP